MSDETPRAPLRINRKLLAFLAATFIVTAIVLLFRNGLSHYWGGTFANVGALLWATWLVLPKDGKIPEWLIPTPWTAAGILLLLFLFVRRPQLMLPILGALVMGAMFLRPKPRR